MRWIGIGLLVLWFILKFGLHKGGYVHILLVGDIAVLFLHLIAYRKTQYHKSP
ncbi:MAG TPA: hypothetical protein VGC61_00045 [Pyrinomonadaceae bacterium]|jgi:uncharacterized membrane protein